MGESELKRYLVFSYREYYPVGGWFDFAEEFDSIDAAKAWSESNASYDFVDIVDTQTKEIVVEGICHKKDGYQSDFERLVLLYGGKYIGNKIWEWCEKS